MKDKIAQHPALNYAQEIDDICNPLKKLDISYFAHAHIDNQGNFTALNNNPEFMEVYLKNKYYNADIHMAKNDKFGNYVLWDALELAGTSKKMDNEASRFGVKHPFTIIEKDKTGSNFYHFANNHENKQINQVYLSNLDLLKKFVSFFKDNVKQSNLISTAYDLTFNLDKSASGYTVKNASDFIDPEKKRSDFLDSILYNCTHDNSKTLIHKDSNQQILLSPQRLKCLKLLIEGNSAKGIAKQLNLSPRTVNHYLEQIRKLLGCRTSKEMIATYFSQIVI